MSPDDGEQAVADATASPPSPRKKKILTVGIVVGIMLLEGVGVFVLVRMTSGPPEAAAGGEVVEDPNQVIEQMDAELPLADCDAINRKVGQSIVVHLSLSVRVAAPDADRAAKLIEKRQSTIKDRVQMILRSADPQHLNEPNLDTVKRQVKFELDKILEDDQLIQEVLIPQILQTRSRN